MNIHQVHNFQKPQTCTIFRKIRIAWIVRIFSNFMTIQNSQKIPAIYTIQIILNCLTIPDFPCKFMVKVIHKFYWIVYNFQCSHVENFLPKNDMLKFTTTKLYWLENIVIFHHTLYYTTKCIKLQCKNICNKQMFFFREHMFSFTDTPESHLNIQNFLKIWIVRIVWRFRILKQFRTFWRF